MQKGFRFLCVIILLIGTLSFSLAWEKRKKDMEPLRSYVAVFFEAQTTPDGTMTIQRWRTEYIKATGEFRTVMHGSDAGAAFADDRTAFSGTSSPVYGKTQEGGFIKGSNAKEKKVMNDIPPSEDIERPYHSRNFLKSMSQFVRMDKVAGLEVYVTRLVPPDNPEYWVEVSYSPFTGRHPLRTVFHQPNGTLFTIEAVKVEFRDVSDNLNEDMQALPSTGNFGDKAPPSKNPN